MGGQYKPSHPHYREGPYSWPSQAQREAYLAALHQLFETYPARSKVEQFERDWAIKDAQSGVIPSAHRCAIAGGVPEAHLTSIEALLF